MKQDFLKLYQEFENERQKDYIEMFERLGANTPSHKDPTFLEFIKWLQK